ncbi:cuticle protein [Holotrichia oblita]|uniref:Cuticle protein n=1 Tax=Holotrichia oblita TaxID=644536 RepID=A0ACB9SXA5_HOLOL|nr:cuticle protein [Holotrichia oblita]
MFFLRVLQLFLLLCVGVATAARLDNTYLPPSSAGSAGGNAEESSGPSGPGGLNGLSSSYGAPSRSVGPSPVYGAPNGYQNGNGNGYRSAEARANILRFNNENNGDGNYRFEFETENKISQQEVGQVKDVAPEGGVTVVQGTYSYVGDDGQTYTVNYVADENGFQPTGDHIHNEIQQAAAEAARSAASEVGYPASQNGYSGQNGYNGQNGSEDDLNVSDLNEFIEQDTTIMLAFLLFVGAVVAEPPISNNYLPPSLSSGRLNNNYLPPSINRISSANRQFSSLNGGQFASVQQQYSHTQAIVPPSSSYGVPSGSVGPAPVYGPPNGYHNGNGRSSAEARANILRFQNENNGDGNYRFEYETENKISQQEVGQVKNIGQDGDATVVQGTYSYVGDDGQTYTVNYIADENGFQPAGEHIHKDIQMTAAEAARTAASEVGYPNAYNAEGGYRY